MILLQTQIGTNLALDSFKFRQTEGAVAGQFVLLGILAVIVTGVVIGLIFYMRRRRRLNEMAHAREEARLKLLLSEYGLGPEAREMLETITGSEDPGDSIPLLESREAFEQTLAQFVEANPEHEIVRRAPGLRQRMGYGFGNLRYPFDNSRMLVAGTKLRCRLRLGGREASFVTSVLAVSERNFFIKAPTAKGKPLQLKNLRQLTLRLSRQDDAEYEFTVPVLGQTSTATSAIVCGHVGNIQKLLFRNAPRVAVSVQTQFYVVRQEVAQERAHFQFKAQESQYALTGELKDISQSGAMAELQVTKSSPRLGDVIVFKLPQAQIKEDLVGQVVGTSSAGDHALNVHLQFAGMNELNRLKLNKFIQIVENQAPAPESAPESPAPSSSPS